MENISNNSKNYVTLSVHKDYGIRSSIKYVRKKFRKTNISYPRYVHLCVSEGKK